MDIKITGLDELQRKLDRIAKAADPKETARKWRSATCPEHGRAASNVRVSGDKVTADFCSEPTRARTVKAMEDGINRAMR